MNFCVCIPSHMLHKRGGGSNSVSTRILMFCFFNEQTFFCQSIWLWINPTIQLYLSSIFTFCHLNRLFSQTPVINDDLPFKILSGSVIVKPNVKEIRGSTVTFDDGSSVENVREPYYILFLKVPLCWKYFFFHWHFMSKIRKSKISLSGMAEDLALNLQSTTESLRK